VTEFFQAHPNLSLLLMSLAFALFGAFETVGIGPKGAAWAWLMSAFFLLTLIASLAGLEKVFEAAIPWLLIGGLGIGAVVAVVRRIRE
jgi:hypothetical protein